MHVIKYHDKLFRQAYRINNDFSIEKRNQKKKEKRERQRDKERKRKERTKINFLLLGLFLSFLKSCTRAFNIHITKEKN